MLILKSLSKKIHPSYALLFFCVAIIASDVFVVIIKPTLFASPLWLFLAIALFLLTIVNTRPVTLLFVIVSAFIIISFRSAPELIAKTHFEALIKNQKEILVSGTVIKDPTRSENGKYSVALATSFPGTIFTQLNSLEITDGFILQRSDYLTIKGIPSETFSDSYIATFSRPKIESVERPEPGDIFLKIRNYFADKIKHYIPEPQSGIAIGYLLGQKSGVDQSFQSTLRAVGLTHIIVASGAHLGAIISLARKIFGKLSRFASLLAAILATLLFIGLTGLSASMLRAGLVTGLSLICWYFGRKIQPVRLILIVAAITLIYNPFYFTDLAWLLSFASFTGILVLAPIITKFFYGKSRKPNYFFTMLITSLSAALLCTPILLYFFGQTSLISIIANLLILPTVPVVMGLTFVTGITAIVVPPITSLVAFFVTTLINYQIFIINFFGEQNIFLIQIDPENPAVFLLYFPLIVVIVIVLCYSKFKLLKNK